MSTEHKDLVWKEIVELLSPHFDGPAARVVHPIYGKIRYLAGNKTYEDLRKQETPIPPPPPLEDPMSKQRATLSGRPPETNEPIGAPAAIDPATGMHKDYWVLPEEERKKGFVRPYRDSYVHDTCSVRTRMAQALSETYARSPSYYGSTYCCGCKTHFPVGQFKWDDGHVVGS